MKEYEKPQMEIIELSGADVNTGCEVDVTIPSVPECDYFGGGEGDDPWDDDNF